MVLESELFNPEKFTHDPIHEFDLHVVRVLNAIATSNGGTLLLSGSLGIEALSHRVIPHNDIDCQIFTPEIHSCPQRIDKQLGIINLSQLLNIEPETASGNLEYRYQVNLAGLSTLIEIKFLEILFASTEGETTIYEIINADDRRLTVPTVLASLTNAGDRKVDCRVKSLPYQVATWAIRLSGAICTKRPMLERDKEHFRLLLSLSPDLNQVFEMMKIHPQMPNNVNAGDLFDLAMTACNIAKD